jgi:hypothetical protein
LKNVEGVAHRRNCLRQPARPPADIPQSNNQFFPSENLVNNSKPQRIKNNMSDINITFIESFNNFSVVFHIIRPNYHDTKTFFTGSSSASTSMYIILKHSPTIDDQVSQNCQTGANEIT